MVRITLEPGGRRWDWMPTGEYVGTLSVEQKVAQASGYPLIEGAFEVTEGDYAGCAAQYNRSLFVKGEYKPWALANDLYALGLIEGTVDMDSMDAVNMLNGVQCRAHVALDEKRGWGKVERIEGGLEVPEAPAAAPAPPTAPAPPRPSRPAPQRPGPSATSKRPF